MCDSRDISLVFNLAYIWLIVHMVPEDPAYLNQGENDILHDRVVKV